MNTELKSVTEQVKSPGRPRSCASHFAIMEAVLDLLSSGKAIRSLTIEEISACAGVGKATIYKWWTNKTFVALDAFLGRMQQGIPTEDTGSAQKDFLHQLQAAICFYDSSLGHIFRQFLAECQNDEAFARAYRSRFLEPRRAAVRVIWSRGVERGEIDARFSCELVIDMIYAPMVYRLLAGHLSFTAEDASLLTEAVFRGIQPVKAQNKLMTQTA